MSIYSTYLTGLIIVFVAALAAKGFSKSPTTATPNFLSFQRLFLFVYLTMMAADWMQGPYVYKLYDFYGFTRKDNGILFIAGFGSSMVFGTWAGPMADKYGRKMNCILYGVSYTLSCATKHFPNFGILMVGRLLGGFATSILWSAFESWMVSEHNSRQHDPSLIGSTFSLMITLNGIVAILSGFVAQWSVDTFQHPVAPFDVSAAFLVLGTIVIWFSWSENYGETKHDMMGQMKDAISKIKADPRIAYVGLSQSLFEGAMYTFVFMWTPTLESPEGIPHGLIFSSFMISCSLGGTLFGLVEKKLPIHVAMRYVFLVAAACMAVPMLTSNHTAIMGSFIIFEIGVGMFWPGIGTLRSKYVPEEARATIMNLFRVPLNFMVCVVLYFQGDMQVSTVFSICTVFHLGAVVSSYMLGLAIGNVKDEKTSDDSETAELKIVE